MQASVVQRTLGLVFVIVRPSTGQLGEIVRFAPWPLRLHPSAYKVLWLFLPIMNNSTHA